MLTKILSEQIIINYSIEGLKMYQHNSVGRNDFFFSKQQAL